MSERQKIEERIRKKQAEVLSLEEKVKAAKVYVSALQDVLKLLDPSGEADQQSETRLKAGSSVAQARDIILERGVPVHIDELLKAMGKAVTAGTRSSLVGSIAAYVRRDEIFSRTAPNTFGLIELGHTEDTEEDSDEPPAGFGREPVSSVTFDDDVPF